MSTSSDGFNIQVEDFAAAAPTMQAAGDELADAAKRITARLESLGSFWGTTADGPEFGDKYEAYAAKVLTLAAACGIDLQATSTGLSDMGKQYGVTEAQITAALKDLHR